MSRETSEELGGVLAGSIKKKKSIDEINEMVVWLDTKIFEYEKIHSVPGKAEYSVKHIWTGASEHRRMQYAGLLAQRNMLIKLRDEVSLIENMTKPIKLGSEPPSEVATTVVGDFTEALNIIHQGIAIIADASTIPDRSLAWRERAKTYLKRVDPNTPTQ